MSNPNFDTILATTLKNYGPTLTDNIFNSTPLLWKLNSKGRIRKLSGGQSIVESIVHEQGETTSYGAYDSITINPVDTATAAEYPWRQLAATIAISGLEELQNSGKEQVYNLFEAKVMQAEKTFKNDVNRQLYANGTGNGGLEFLGLDALVGDHTTSVTTVGGIDSVANAYWRSIVDNFVDASGTLTELGPLYTAYNSASDGNDKVDCVFTDQTQFEAYEALLTPNIRYTDTESVNAGFMNLTVKGVPMYWDPQAPAATFWGLNSKYIKLVGHSNRWFKQSKFTDNMADAGAAGASTVVDARYSLITTAGNLTTNNRRRNFKLTVSAV